MPVDFRRPIWPPWRDTNGDWGGFYASLGTVVGSRDGGDDDWYRFSLGAGDSAYLYANQDEVWFNVHGAAGTLIAWSAGSSGEPRKVGPLTHLPGDSEYLVRVYSALPDSYTLSLLRNAELHRTVDTAPPHGAAPLGRSGVAIGYHPPSESPGGTKFEFVASAGDALDITLSTPAIGDPNDQLQGRIALYDSLGGLLGASAFTSSAAPLEAFSSAFSVDSSGPRVVSSSLREGDAVRPGDRMVVLRFDEPLDPDVLDPSDVQLLGQVSGLHEPSYFYYDPNSSTLMLEYPSLLEDHFTLTLHSGPDSLRDVIGNELDGEWHVWGQFPSGDGVPGGDFVLEFDVNVVVDPLPTPLAPIAPLGSLIYETSDRGIGSEIEVSTFTVDLKAGNTAAVIVEPDAGSGLQAEVRLIAPDQTVVATAAASDLGLPVVLQAVSIPDSGGYRVEVVGQRGAGYLTVRLVLNAAVEFEAYAGPTNDDLASAQSIQSSFAAPGAGLVTRGAALGELTAGEEDWYRFSLQEGEAANLHLDRSDVGVDLYDSSGILLTRSAAAANEPHAIRVTRMDNPLDAAPVFTDFLLAVTPYGQPGTEYDTCIYHLPGDARIRNVQWRDGPLLAGHTVETDDAGDPYVNTSSHARWYLIDAAGSAPAIAHEEAIEDSVLFDPTVTFGQPGEIGFALARSIDPFASDTYSGDGTSLYVASHVDGMFGAFTSQLVPVASTEQGYCWGIPSGYASARTDVAYDPATDSFWAAASMVSEGDPPP